MVVLAAHTIVVVAGYKKRLAPRVLRVRNDLQRHWAIGVVVVVVVANAGDYRSGGFGAGSQRYAGGRF